MCVYIYIYYRMFTMNNFETTDIAEMYFYYCLSFKAKSEEIALALPLSGRCVVLQSIP